MAPAFDIHVHTNLSACADADMTLAAIVSECERLGRSSVGIADHVNHPDHVARNAALLAGILRLQTPVGVFLGAEDNYLPEFGGHSISPQLKARFGYQYVIGSHHNLYLPPGCAELERIVRAQHEHHIETCRHPAMDILGHPFRYLKGTLERCGLAPSDMDAAMPEAMVRELGRTARDTATAVEINVGSFLEAGVGNEVYAQGYRRLVRLLVEEGVCFALGSDAHRIRELSDIALGFDFVTEMGIDAGRIWRPPGTPVNMKRAQGL